MQLLIVRHADAGDRDAFAATGRPDSERPLSEKGVEQMRAAAPRIRDLVPEVDHLVTSPYARARETAEILRREYRAVSLLETASLEPDEHPKAFARYLRDLGGEVVLCVGHEPHLGELTAWLTSGERKAYMDFKKGGACLVECDGAPRKGSGVLRWLVGPKELGR
jgi:phosphohistidine phosphatase